jgi:hypothetical protein
VSNTLSKTLALRQNTRLWLQSRRALIFSAPPGRALLETLVFNLILSTAVSLLDISPVVKRQAIFFFIQPLGGLWYSLRLRPVRGLWWQQVIGEGIMAVVASVTLLATPLLFAQVFIAAEQPRRPGSAHRWPYHHRRHGDHPRQRG